MSDGRLWWMLNLLGLLTLTAAVFTALGWWLRVLMTREQTPVSTEEDLKAARDELANMETQLHETEGALRRCEAELARLQALKEPTPKG